jgi:hypothetical protein
LAEFYRTSKVWVVDYTYDGRPRRWFKAAPTREGLEDAMSGMLREWYGDRARLVVVRAATPDEEASYLRGDEPRNVYCPTG